MTIISSRIAMMTANCVRNDSVALRRYSPIPVAKMKDANNPMKTMFLTALSLDHPNFSTMECERGSINAIAATMPAITKTMKKAGATT